MSPADDDDLTIDRSLCPGLWGLRTCQLIHAKTKIKITNQHL